MRPMELRIGPHPLLRAAAFSSEFPRPLGELPSPGWLVALLALEAETPLRRDEDARAKVRDLLRHGGYRPTGRGKPASEYLVRAAGDGTLASINLAVDACNAVSLASALPISVVDLDRAAAPFRIGLAAAGERYVFNAAGQEIELAGLLCLFDAEGPCANAVKDAQRTKTTGATRRTLSVVWAAATLEERLEQAVRWYRELLERAGASTAPVPPA
jgi:DNA/RNA-binding domain of Phe-tRNA-synthetase-like protein